MLMEKIKVNYKGIIFRLLFSLSIGFLSKIYLILNNYRGKVYHLKTVLDDMIPFNKYFVIPYLYWYIYIAAVLIYFAVVDGKKYFKLLLSILVGMGISCIIYYFFPTTVSRPLLKGEDVFTKLVFFIYKKDNPYNCFPSIHVINSCLAAIYVNREGILKNYKMISTLIAVSIILSTLFIKQHYVYDVLAGIIVSYIIYFAFNHSVVLDRVKQRYPLEINR
ncbi:PAP2 superfamily protein [Caloramator fervidus]|uniref:PAP2 superfamily protein n=1 Tax=Caloramator fervidus TaxID=29344 RepID=A0A1H5UUM0_9CLOT|nr:phosphatase PAP2 family protein [Caloramator fervidus]SEF78765.1 PAP2 superfamily protein [Caloramator fervidus]